MPKYIVEIGGVKVPVHAKNEAQLKYALTVLTKKKEIKDERT